MRFSDLNFLRKKNLNTPPLKEQAQENKKVQDFLIESIDAAGVNRNGITKTPLIIKLNTHGDDFKIYSFGEKPRQNISFANKFYRSNGSFSLPEHGSAVTDVNGGSAIGIGGVAYTSKFAQSHSFSSCTPIVAFYDSGVTALYHAASAAPDDEIRQAMLEKNPRDVFIITKTGHGQHTLRQSAHALDILNYETSKNINIHIVEVKRSTLSVKASYGSLEITSMD